MRVFAFCVVMTLCAACGQATSAQRPPSAPVATSAVAQAISPAGVARARTTLPAGYEVSALPSDPTPFALWGLGANWTSDPVGCGGLGRPFVTDAPVTGWSASGPGGIVYVVAAEASAEGSTVGPADCAPWTVSTEHTTATITFGDAPPIGEAVTTGLLTDLVSQVEGGTETHSHAETFSATLGGYATYVVVVTDPGSAGPALPAGFASTLLVDAVAAMRS